MTAVKSNELIGHHYEGDRWLRRDDDFYYLYSVDEPEIWISYIPNFDKWSNSTDLVLRLWYWEVDFAKLNRLCWRLIDPHEISTGIQLDVTERYHELEKEHRSQDHVT
jgi:hypothetical protein